jgi:hypothetical protein
MVPGQAPVDKIIRLLLNCVNSNGTITLNSNVQIRSVL